MVESAELFEFRLPSLGADMEHGTVLDWLVGPGDEVHRGDVVASVETEKSDIDVEIWHDGVIVEVLVPVGTTVEVGAPLALLRPLAADAAPPAAPPVAPPTAARADPVRAEQVRAEPPPPVVPPPVVPPPLVEPAIHSPLVRHLADRKGLRTEALTPTGPGGRITRADVEQASVAPVLRPTVRLRLPPGKVAASPAARHLAAQRGIDLAAIAGSGPSGAVVRADVERHRPAAPAADRTAAMRAAIARQMSRAKREIPHYYLRSTMDVSAAMGWLTTENEARPVEHRLLPAALLLTAVAKAAARHPEMNGHYVDDTFTPAGTVELGVVVALRGGGLMAPVIDGAEALGVDGVMAELKALVTRTRTGKLRSSDTAPASITVTNLGDLGADEVLGVIHPPQVAIVGFGRIAERAVVVDGAVVARPTVTVTLAADHRVSDGIAGSRFLSTIASLLEAPEQL